MTDPDLLELDIWIAEKFMGWSRIDGPTYGPSWVDKDKRIITREVTSFPSPFMPSSDPSAFALVKREIEQRGGAWAINYHSRVKQDGNDPFFCSVWLPNSQPSEVWASSEELAGCLAVKAAMEGSK